MASPEESCNYHENLRGYLIPRLSYCMQIAAQSESKDPIEFIGTHLNHLSKENAFLVST